MLVALHEAAAERSPCKIQPLQDPDPSHQNHQDTDKAAYHSHYRVEHTTHRSPHRIAPPRNMRIDLILPELLPYAGYSARTRFTRTGAQRNRPAMSSASWALVRRILTGYPLGV